MFHNNYLDTTFCQSRSVCFGATIQNRLIPSQIHPAFLGTISHLPYEQSFMIWFVRVVLFLCCLNESSGLAKLRERVAIEC